MSEQEVNIILNKYGDSALTDYTTNWNAFHRVWIKWLKPDVKGKVADSEVDVAIQILNNPTPLQAATALAEVIKSTT